MGKGWHRFNTRVGSGTSIGGMLEDDYSEESSPDSTVNNRPDFKYKVAFGERVGPEEQFKYHNKLG